MTGFPLEFCERGGLKNTRMMRLPECQKEFDDVYVRLDTVQALDGQKCRKNIELCMHCMLTRDKKT